MKIGVYFREAEMPEGGGGHTFESTLLEAIRKVEPEEDHDFVFLGPAGAVSKDLVASGFDFIPIPIEGLARAWLRLPRLGDAPLRSVREMSRRGRLATGLDHQVIGSGIDILWCLGPDVPSREIPYLVTVWDLQHRLQPFFPEVSADGVWERRERYFSRALRRATFVITGTQVGKAEIERFYGIASERIIVAPHPVPEFPEPSGPDAVVLERLGVEPGFLLYPAQFWPHKNHVSLLHALRTVIHEGLDTRLVLVGSDHGRNRAFVESEIDRLGLRPHVTTLGFVARQDLAALYRSAGALTYVSLFGPENLPPLEAFSLGCPVIATAVRGAEEQLGDAAILVPPADDQSLAEAIVRLYGDQDLRDELVAKGLRRECTPARFCEDVLGSITRFEKFRRAWPS